MAESLKDDFYNRLRKDYYACRARDGHVRASFVYRFLAAREASKNARRTKLAAERNALLQLLDEWGSAANAPGFSAEASDRAAVRRRVQELDAMIAQDVEHACEVFFENHGYPVSRQGAVEKRGRKRDKALDMIDAFCSEQGLRLSADAQQAIAAQNEPSLEEAESLYDAVAFDSERRRMFAPLFADAHTGVVLAIVGIDWLRAELALEVLRRFASDSSNAPKGSALHSALTAPRAQDAVEAAIGTGEAPVCFLAVIEPEEYIPEEVEYIQANTSILFSVSYNDGAQSVLWDFAQAFDRYEVVRAERLNYFVRVENGYAPQECSRMYKALFRQVDQGFDTAAYERAMLDLDTSLESVIGR